MHQILSMSSCFVLQALHPPKPPPSHKASFMLSKRDNFNFVFWLRQLSYLVYTLFKNTIINYITDFSPLHITVAWTSP